MRVSTCLADLLRTVTLKSVKLITVNRACIVVKHIHSANYICLISLLIKEEKRMRRRGIGGISVWHF